MEGGSSQTIGGTTKDDAVDGPETDLVEGVIDVWEDQGVLHRMQRGVFPPDATSHERDRIAHRMARFNWKGGMIFRRWRDGTRKVVSRPDQRL